jgi:hypothetical protein
MRTYGRVAQSDGTKTWVEVTTDANGFNDEVYLTTLAQVLQLNPGESPFYANYGIPSQQSVVTQVFPDYFVALTQQQFANYFAALTLTKKNTPNPRYVYSVVTNYGAIINDSVGVPT